MSLQPWRVRIGHIDFEFPAGITREVVDAEMEHAREEVKRASRRTRDLKAKP